MDGARPPQTRGGRIRTNPPPAKYFQRIRRAPLPASYASLSGSRRRMRRVCRPQFSAHYARCEHWCPSRCGSSVVMPRCGFPGRGCSQPRAAERLGSGAALFSQRQPMPLALNALKTPQNSPVPSSDLWVTVTGRAVCLVRSCWAVEWRNARRCWGLA